MEPSAPQPPASGPPRGLHAFVELVEQRRSRVTLFLAMLVACLGIATEITESFFGFAPWLHVTNLVSVLAALGLAYLASRGRSALAASGLIALVLLTLVLLTASMDGFRPAPFVWLGAPLLLAGATLGPTGVMLTSVGTVGTLGILAWITQAPHHQPPLWGAFMAVTLGLVVLQSVVALLQAMGMQRDMAGALERELRLAEAERAAQAQAARLAFLAENMQDAAVLYDEQGAVLYATPSARGVLGVDPAVLAGNPPLEPGDERGRVVACWRDALERGAARCALRLQEGAAVRFLDVVLHRVDEGPHRRVVLTARDVTEARALAEQLEQSQKMEALGLLAGGVAHDFNNVLALIHSGTTMAREELPADHPVQQDLQDVEAATRRAAALTRQLLAFSRRQVATPGGSNLPSVVQELHPLLQRLLGSGVRVLLEAAETDLPVQLGRTQLEQVLLNLAINARDAMPDSRGTLHLEVRRQGPLAVLTVRDDGAGMPPAVQARLFEPFFTTKPPGSGTGLGLTTCRTIVHGGGGEIAVESTLGQGTRFTIQLPITAPVPRVSVARSCWVLVVDDEPGIRELAAGVLRGQGHHVEEAAGGEEALLLASHHVPDVVVTDVAMAPMGGLHLADELSRRHPQVRTVLMSGYAQDQDALRRLLDRGVGFLAKPFSADALRQAVAQALATAPQEDLPAAPPP